MSLRIHQQVLHSDPKIKPPSSKQTKHTQHTGSSRLGEKGIATLWAGSSEGHPDWTTKGVLHLKTNNQIPCNEAHLTKRCQPRRLL